MPGESTTVFQIESDPIDPDGTPDISPAQIV